LKKLEDKFNYEGVEFPATFEDIKRFELNNGVAVFVYCLGEQGKVVKERNGNPKFRDKPIYLLRVEASGQAHYIYIKHISRLLNLVNHKGDQLKRYCPYCGKLYTEDKIPEAH
jgi:hypothetical protein